MLNMVDQTSKVGLEWNIQGNVCFGWYGHRGMGIEYPVPQGWHSIHQMQDF